MRGDGVEYQSSWNSPTAPLICAAKKGRTECVRLLLELGANKNATDQVRTACERKNSVPCLAAGANLLFIPAAACKCIRRLICAISVALFIYLSTPGRGRPRR